MRNFTLIDAGLDMVPLRNALALNEGLWNANPLRTTHPASPHHEADDIWLFFNEVPADPAAVFDDIAVRPYPAWWALPQVRPLVFGLMRRVEGVQLGRCILTRLRPGASIPPHVDEGAPATYFTRYQIAVQSLPGAVFRAEDETVTFGTGEAWLVNNRVEHAVTNNSADDRIVLIVDIRVPTC